MMTSCALMGQKFIIPGLRQEFGIVSGGGTEVRGIGVGGMGKGSVPARLGLAPASKMTAVSGLQYVASRLQRQVGWGRGNLGQTDVPTNVTNAIDISAGGKQSLALREGGTVVHWGETNAPVPADRPNVTAMASETNIRQALFINGTVGAWGWPGCGKVGLARIK